MQLSDVHQALNNSTIGIAGCGAMGLPMAKALRRAGFEVWGFDVRPSAEFGDFAERMIEDPATFGQRCDIVISVVRDAKQTEDLCFDKQAIFTTAEAAKTLIVCSTLSPRFLHRLRERLPGFVTTVDAPMSGAPIAAEQETLTFMLGGDDDAIETLMPLFQIMGHEIHCLGGYGAGMTCKVLNNFVTATGVVAVRRVLADAPTLGLEPEKLLAVMKASSGGTWYGSNIDRISWSKETHSPENTIGILEKDVRAFLDAATAVEGGEYEAFDDALLEGLRSLPPYPED